MEVVSETLGPARSPNRMSFLQSLFHPRPSAAPRVPSPDQPRRLALYTHDFCGPCVRVKQTLKRSGIEVEIRDVLADRAHRDDLRERTGRNTVPCLLVDDVPLFESADIVHWLEAYAAQ